MTDNSDADRQKNDDDIEEAKRRIEKDKGFGSKGKVFRLRYTPKSKQRDKPDG